MAKHVGAKLPEDLIEILKSEFPDLRVKYQERDKFMPERGTLSIDKAKELINYSPKHSIENGYIKYIDWYKKFWQALSK